MSLPLFSESQFRRFLLSGEPLIDVRAPVEFAEGSIPGSVNLPILNNQERALIGTTYKQAGQAAAVKLGHELVSGAVKEERVRAWRGFLKEHPKAIVTCFRGGLRSQITQTWLKEVGVEVPRVDGGYKRLRTYCLQLIKDFTTEAKLEVVSGATGSGKTLLLRDLQKTRLVCDLEAAAHHRGSAFGGYGDGQPSQVDFENQVAIELLRALEAQRKRPLLIEDESRLIGRCVQPESLFVQLRNSPVILIEEDLSTRVEVTFADYILGSDLMSEDPEKAEAVMVRYRESLRRISKKLGGLKTQGVLAELEGAWTEQKSGRGPDLHRRWIETLLRDYYDPMYLGSLAKRQPQVLFRGTRAACLEFLR